MRPWMNALLIAGILGTAVLAAPSAVQADDYWDGYWGWYDNTYSPYYQRHYSYSPYYGSGYYGGGYGNPYGGYGYPYGGYGRGGSYYGTQDFGYFDRRGGGGGVNIGGLRFGWR